MFKKLIKNFLLSIVVFITTSFFSSQSTFAAQTGVIVPTSDGFYSQWTPKSGSTHYVMVDENPCNGLTDHNRTTIVGRRDSYGINLSSIPNGSTITQIDITPCASKKSSGGASTLDVFYRLNGVNSSDLGSYALTGTTPLLLSTTSFSGLSIVKNGTTSAEIGAIFTSGNRGARLSQISTQITYSLPLGTVTTNDATGIASNAGTLNSTANPQGSSASVYYKYGTSNISCSSLPFTAGPLGIGSGTSDVSPNSVTILSLVSNTTYYFCALVSNGGGVTFGNVLNFTTLP